MTPPPVRRTNHHKYLREYRACRHSASSNTPLRAAPTRTLSLLAAEIHIFWFLVLEDGILENVLLFSTNMSCYLDVCCMCACLHDFFILKVHSWEILRASN
jgi:hypothetical protein